MTTTADETSVSRGQFVNLFLHAGGGPVGSGFGRSHLGDDPGLSTNGLCFGGSADRVRRARAGGPRAAPKNILAAANRTLVHLVTRFDSCFERWTYETLNFNTILHYPKFWAAVSHLECWELSAHMPSTAVRSHGKGGQHFWPSGQFRTCKGRRKTGHSLTIHSLPKFSRRCSPL